MLTRRRFLLQTAAAAQREPARPNLLLLLAGPWRAQALPSAGDRQLEAPALARLAAEGLHCGRAYTACPQSTPSRAALITGRFPHSSRVTNDQARLAASEPSLAQELAAAGYATGFIGQWRLDGDDEPGFVPPGPRRKGFAYWAAFNRGYSYFRSTYLRDEPKPILVEGFEPDYQTQLAADFIHRNRQSPFFLMLAWGPPHEPRTPPPDLASRYRPEDFHPNDNVPLAAEPKAREALAGYYGLCTALDRCLGRLLDALDRDGLARDTIVVFTSDHGELLGAHSLDGYDEPYEETARVPLLIRYPHALGAATRTDLLISNIDLMPTLLALCGASAPDPVQGANLAGLLRTGQGAHPESIYAEGRLGTPQEWRMIVRGYDKLAINRAGEVTHLYNLATDPLEMSNQASSEAERRRKDELRALLEQWKRRSGDGRSASGLKQRRK